MDNTWRHQAISVDFSSVRFSDTLACVSTSTANAQATTLYIEIENYTFKITAFLPEPTN